LPLPYHGTGGGICCPLIGITNLFRLIAVFPHNPQIFLRLRFLETFSFLRTPLLPDHAEYAKQKKNTDAGNYDGELHATSLGL
jgi:hypothetical protein